MKMFESKIGCRNIRREIEEAGQDEALRPAVNVHLKACGECETFFDEQFKLRTMVASLGTVAAPNDFEFRLRARLADEKSKPSRGLTTGSFSFGHGVTAFAAILLLVGSAFLVMRLRPDTDTNVTAGVSQSVVTPSSSAGTKGKVAVQAAPPVLATVKSGEPLNSTSTRPRRNRNPIADQLATARNGNSRDLASSVAPRIRADQLLASDSHSVFPIDSAPEALKVSVNNGRGTPKTISVPGVSFGSQRVLTQNPTPLMASSRGAW